VIESREYTYINASAIVNR